MSARRGIILLLLSTSAIVPIIFGASCPPASTPLTFIVAPDNNTLAQAAVPGCITGFVCINLANGATIPVQIALYQHNGFDLNDTFADPPAFSCCTNPNSQSPCVCPCPGKTTGDCLLNRTEIFLTANQSPVNGQLVVTLAPNQTILKRVRCGDVKTVGAAVAQLPGDPVLAPDDRNGPIYRDEPGGVACGQTVQFLAVDLNQSGTVTPVPGQSLAALILRAQFSQ